MKIIHITAHKLFLGGGERLIDGWVANSKHESVFYVCAGGIEYANPAFKTYATDEELAAIVLAERNAVVVVHDPFLGGQQWLADVPRLVWYVHGAFAFAMDVRTFAKPLFAISNYKPATKHRSWDGIFVAPVHLGVDCSKYVPTNIPHSGGIIVGIVGRVAEEKCPLYFFDFIDTFNQAHPDHNFQFHYCGRGVVDSDFYKQFIARAAKTLNFYYKGFVDKDQAPTLYQRFDCLLVPSLSESGSFAILEAQACGLRVYALNHDGIPYHLATNSVGCKDYDDLFKRLQYFNRRDGVALRPLIRAEMERKYNLPAWVYKLDVLAEMASFI